MDTLGGLSLDDLVLARGDALSSSDEVDWVTALIKAGHLFREEQREQKRRRVLLAECGPASGVSRRGGGPR